MSNWKDKVVVVTGGSAGLGRAIVEAFASDGATVISISRSKHENSDRVFSVVADVTDDQSVTKAIATIVETHGSIDVWVNNVGQSIRVAFAESKVDEYRQLMETNFFSALRCSLTVLPHLKKSSGSIVNIGSLAARTGWKHVGPYVTSKHALSGLAHQIRIEGPENVHSLFVFTGPIQRDDSETRYQQQSANLDPSAAKPGAGVKISGIDPKKLAALIVAAVEKRKPELVVPVKTRLLFSILQLSPRLGDWILRKFS